jgi:hypothetical protein
MSNKNWKKGEIFVTFSEYLNFIRDFRILGQQVLVENFLYFNLKRNPIFTKKMFAIYIGMFIWKTKSTHTRRANI